MARRKSSSKRNGEAGLFDNDLSDVGDVQFAGARAAGADRVWLDALALVALGEIRPNASREAPLSPPTRLLSPCPATSAVAGAMGPKGSPTSKAH